MSDLETRDFFIKVYRRLLELRREKCVQSMRSWDAALQWSEK